MDSTVPKFDHRAWRPLVLLLVFALLWQARGRLHDVAQAASAEAARLAATCDPR